MVQPVQQSFDYAGYWAPTPTFQTTESEAPRTLELAPLEVYSTISYDEAYDQTFDCSLTYLAETAAEFNAVRFVTQNILAIALISIIQSVNGCCLAISVMLSAKPDV